MSYAKDWTYICIYYTKLIKKQKQAFKIEKQTIFYFFKILFHFFKFNLLTPFDYNWSHIKAWFTSLFSLVYASNCAISKKGPYLPKKWKFQGCSSIYIGMAKYLDVPVLSLTVGKIEIQTIIFFLSLIC